jgi:DNA repair exonuclease SbcCD nuclease subunit
MPTVLHLSDTHLGSAVYGSAARRSDFTDAFVQAVELAVDEAVDAVVHTGDLTDSSDWDENLPERALDALETLRDAGIPFLFVLGNHDTTDSGRPQAWVGELESAGLGTRLSTDATDVAGVAVYGVDYHDADWWRSHDVEFEPAIGDPPTLLCLHQTVEPFCPPGEGELDLAAFLDRSPVAFDAVLLGHKHATLERDVDGTLATYAGTTERVTRAERDNTPKVNLVTVTDDGVERTARDLETRPFAERTVIAGPATDEETLGAELRSSLPDGGVLTLHLVARDGGPVSTADVERLVEPLDPVDVDVRDAPDRWQVEAGVYECGPDDLDGAGADGTPAETAAAAETATAADTASTTGTGQQAVTEPASPYEAYVAGLEPRDGVCDFVFEPSRWAAHFGVDPDRDRWACPRAVDDGCCAFHAPLADRDRSPAETADAFCDAVESDGENEFVGARFRSLDLSYRNLDSPDRYPVDLSYARVDDGVDLSQAVVRNQLRLDGLSTRRLHAEAATLEASVDAHRLDVDGTVEFAGTRFERGASFNGSSFQTARFDDCVFDGGASFVDATFDHDATFERASFQGHARFDDATFRGDAGFEHAAFARQARFDDATFEAEGSFRQATFDGQTKFNHATFADHAEFFAVHAQGFLGFYDATFEDQATFYGAGLGPTTHFRRTTFDGPADLRNATFGSDVADFRAATFRGDADFTRARFDGRTAFDGSHRYGPATFDAAATFTRAAFRDDADFVGVTFGGPARFDRTTWHGKAEFGDAPDATREHGTAAFRDRAVFDRAKFNDDVNLSGVRFDGLLSASDLQSRGVLDASRATIRDGATFADSELRALRLDAVTAPGPDPVVTLAGADVARGSIGQRGDHPPLVDLTDARLGSVDVSGDDAAAPAFDTLLVNRTEFDGFEFTSVHDHVPDSWALHRLADRYDDIVRPTPSARDRETTYRNAKNGADAVSDATASAELFQREMACRRERYRDDVAAAASARQRAAALWRYGRNLVLGATTGYGERTGNVIATGLVLALGLFPALYALLNAVRPGELVGSYSSPLGYLQLSLEAFVALVLGDSTAVAGPVAHLLVYGEALLGTLVVAMLVLTLTRSVYR